MCNDFYFMGSFLIWDHGADDVKASVLVMYGWKKETFLSVNETYYSVNLLIFFVNLGVFWETHVCFHLFDCTGNVEWMIM